MFKFNKKGEEEATKPVSLLLRFLLMAAVATALYFMLRGIANAFLPK